MFESKPKHLRRLTNRERAIARRAIRQASRSRYWLDVGSRTTSMAESTPARSLASRRGAIPAV